MNAPGCRRSRSVGPETAALLGTLTDFAFMARQGNVNRVEPESPREPMRFLAQRRSCR